MTQQRITSEARERVLDAAAKLFAERGSAAIGLRHASLYHHAPGGKEELFIEVTARQGLTRVMPAAAPDLRQQLYAAAAWFLAAVQKWLDLLLRWLAATCVFHCARPTALRIIADSGSNYRYIE